MEKWITFGSGIFMTLVLSATMIGFGRLFQKNPPQEINSLYGYRTAQSMKNRETWDFAHHYIGRLWWRIGWWMLAVSTVLHHLLLFVPWMEAVTILLMFLQMIVLILPIFPTEKALKKHFDSFGQRIL